MEENSAFEVAVSISVFVTIWLLILVVFLSIYCLRCSKSESERQRTLSSVNPTFTAVEVEQTEALNMQTSSDEVETMQATVERTIAIAIPQIVGATTVEDQRQTMHVEEQILEAQQAAKPQAPTDMYEIQRENTLTAKWLTTKDLKEVIDLIWPARLKWYCIGVQLGLQMSQLDVIQRDHRDTDECTMAMIQAWLKQEGVTWKELISALKHKTVEFSQLANSISAKLKLEPESSTKFGTSASSATLSPVSITMTIDDPLYSDSADSTDSTDSPFEHLDTRKLTNYESRKLKARLRKDTRTIVTAFSDLVIHMRKSFERTNVNPQALATTVKGIAMRERSTQSLKKSLKLQEVISIDMLVAYLLEENYISFINYHLVEYMILHYGTEEDKRMFIAYERNFKVYCKRSVFEVPQDVFGSIPSDGEKLAFKVQEKVVNNIPSNHTQVEDDEYASDNPTAEASSKNLELSLGNVIYIQEKVAETLDLDVGSLILLGASRGCVELTFSAPKVTVEKVMAQLEVNGLLFNNLEDKGIHILCGPPGKPEANKIQYICHRLDWTKPKYQGFHPIQYYQVHYRSVHDPPKVWRTLQTEGPTESIVIPNEIHLLHKSSFTFKVQAVTDIGCGVDSEESDTVILQPLGTGGVQCYDSYPHTFPRKGAHAVKKNHPLTSNNFQEILNTLNRVRDRWFDIGLKLGINIRILNELRKKYEKSNDDCLRHMLADWLSQGNATREALILALNDLGLLYESKNKDWAVMSSSDLC